MYHYFASLFERLDPINTALRSTLLPQFIPPVCWCITNIYLQETAGSVWRLLRRRGVFTYVIIALTSHPAPSRLEHKQREATCRFCGASWRISERISQLLLKYLATLEVTFPIENSLLPTRHISSSLWFKPETKEYSLSLLYVSFFKILHPLMISTGKNSTGYFSVYSTVMFFQKVY